MAKEDHAEDYGLFNPHLRNRRSFITRALQQARWNPIMYLSLLFIIYSICGLVIHSLWRFVFGTVFSVLSIGVGVLCAAVFVMMKYKKWTYLNRKEMAKVIAFALVCIIAQALLIWGQSVLIAIHFHATDPHWTTFPTGCTHPPHPNTPLNCVRVGINITNPTSVEGVNDISAPMYNHTTLATIFDIYKHVAKKQLGCRELYADEVWAHYRCLTTFLGKPSDLAFQVSPKDNFIASNGTSSVVPWIHSQARYVDGLSDENANDARVRLLLTNAYQSFISTTES